MWLTVVRAALSVRLPAYITAAISVLLILTTAYQCSQKLGAREATKRAVAGRELAESKLQVCQANEAALETALASSKASMEAVEQEGQRRLKEADKALQRALRGRKEAEKIALELAQPQSGKTVCERVEQTDALVLRSLR